MCATAFGCFRESNSCMMAVWAVSFTMLMVSIVGTWAFSKSVGEGTCSAWCFTGLGFVITLLVASIWQIFSIGKDFYNLHKLGLLYFGERHETRGENAAGGDEYLSGGRPSYENSSDYHRTPKPIRMDGNYMTAVPKRSTTRSTATRSDVDSRSFRSRSSRGRMSGGHRRPSQQMRRSHFSYSDGESEELDSGSTFRRANSVGGESFRRNRRSRKVRRTFNPRRENLFEQKRVHYNPQQMYYKIE